MEVANTSILHETKGLCPTCMKVVHAQVLLRPHGVVLVKHCPVHGPAEDLICPDGAIYQGLRSSPRLVHRPARFVSSVRHGCPQDCGLCPRHEQHTCLAILEITHRCDLGCPVCIAGATSSGEDLSLREVEGALAALLHSQGAPTALQLSGGEPTMHPKLLDIVRMAVSMGFSRVELDTNGLALAENPALAEDLATVGLRGVYLQMDGLRPGIHKAIRGSDLLEQKLAAIEGCLRAALQVVLAVTVVNGINDGCLWEMVRFAAERSLTGVSFQSAALSGRTPPHLLRGRRRFTLGHFLLAMERQSGGVLQGSDFLPIPCPDPRCGAVCYILIKDGDILPLARMAEEERMLPLAAGLSDWEDVIRGLSCSCNGEQGCLKDLSLIKDTGDGTEFFCVAFHGMMDPWSMDLERVKRCCVHALVADGRLIPFCLYRMRNEAWVLPPEAVPYDRTPAFSGGQPRGSER